MIPARVSARLCLGIILILSSIFYSVDADTSHPTNNWREILAIGDERLYYRCRADRIDRT
jgi:hypothetical protein